MVGDYLSTTGAGGELIDTYQLDGSDDENGGDGGTIAVVKLKTLEHNAFLDCLALCFEHVLAVLQRAVLFHRFMAARPADISASASQNGITSGTLFAGFALTR